MYNCSHTRYVVVYSHAVIQMRRTKIVILIDILAVCCARTRVASAASVLT